ncbi:MAG: diacylglycerol kinase family lipid kinase [Acidobacteria bacterium]|nr:diacylglycerol kinase family lipid kinase [Acidobacteriota bacterium]
MSKIEVILNPRSGVDRKKSSAAEVAELFRVRGADVRVSEAGSGEEMADLIASAARSDCEIVVAGGGDGTVSAVAGSLVWTGKTLGVLPMGTLNHFAKDLHIPMELKAAVDVIIAGRTIEIDAGEVNGRFFVNNSSLGIYPAIVQGREQRQRLGYPKLVSLVRSALEVLRVHPVIEVRLSADGKELTTRTPFVFVGNNDYEIEGLNIGSRARLDQGYLGAFMTRRTGRLAPLKLAIRALFGGLSRSQDEDFLTAKTSELAVDSKRPRIDVAMDGEVQEMETPIHYRIHPRALRVRVPAEV